MKIVLEKGQRLFFTSDTHYGHSNICRATTKWTDSDSVTRDFKSLEHMNDTLVNRINETVGEDDILIHLGDFSFGGFENIKNSGVESSVRTFTWFTETMTITFVETKVTSKISSQVVVITFTLTYVFQMVRKHVNIVLRVCTTQFVLGMV
jgi:hypothetical protein